MQYWREYRTYFHIAKDWEVSESPICRTVKKVENVLIKLEKFRLERKKLFLRKLKPRNREDLDTAVSSFIASLQPKDLLGYFIETEACTVLI